jgi:Family of unknown function (DUF5690)
MDMRGAWRLFVDIWPGIVSVIVGYSSLTALRSFRDYFAVEIYTAVLNEAPPSIFYLLADLPAALITGLALSMLRKVTDHRRAVLIMCGLMLLGTVVTLLTALAQDDRVFGARGGPKAPPSKLMGYLWAIVVGIGIYLAYLPQGAMLYDRILASRRDVGTAVFLVFASDLSGYVGTVALLVDNAVDEANSNADDRTVAEVNESFLRYFVNFCYVSSVLNLVAFSCTAVYWWRRLPKGSAVELLDPARAAMMDPEGFL